MDFNKLRLIKEEDKRVNATYEIYNEDSRLNYSKAARVEFLTAIKYIEKHLKNDSRILDIGAGAGEYSLYLAKKGYFVDALELADNNIKYFSKKITPDLKINLKQGNAIDLSSYDENCYDIVLLMGPLYHLENISDQLKALEEAKRVCKKDGKIIITFISNDMVILTELAYNPHFLSSLEFDHNSFAVENFPFVFHTLDQAKELIKKSNLDIINIVAQDGVSELMADKINQLSDEEYDTYLKYHFYCAEKPEMLGRSNHIMFVCKNTDN